jgi:hypothetical protein
MASCPSVEKARAMASPFSREGAGHGSWVMLVPLHRRGTRNGGVLKSRDGGATWTRHGEVANPEGQGGEPTIAETKSGVILPFAGFCEKQEMP